MLDQLPWIMSAVTLIVGVALIVYERRRQRRDLASVRDDLAALVVDRDARLAEQVTASQSAVADLMTENARLLADVLSMLASGDAPSNLKHTETGGHHAERE